MTGAFRLAILFLVSVLITGIFPMRAPADAWRGGYIGVDVGVMQPVQDPFPDFVGTGGTVAPYVGYMFNNWIGFQTQAHVLGAPTDVAGAGQDGDATWWGALAGGPVLQVPFGRHFALGGTFQGLLGTAFTDEALTDTSWGFSTGPSFNFRFAQHFGVGVWSRYNRLYQRVHGKGDPEYVTAGLSFTYYWPAAREEPVPAAPVAAAPPPPVVERKVVPRAVYFDFDKSNIRPDGEATLNEAIRIIKELGAVAVVCEGHTDSRGTEAYNLDLSRRRAKAVRDYLIAGGIPSSAITVEGFGESRPVATNTTDDGRQQNRRVELRVSE